MFRAMNRARHDRIDATLTRVDCPLMIIRGAHDDIARQDWTEFLTRRPGTSDSVAPVRPSVTLSAGAHMVPYTHAHAVARHVSDFMRTPP
jgi:pimeloyl-ACP methyl ester carboxylesterase